MWTAFENGTSVGERGSENGIILHDDEHSSGARITLEKDTNHASFAITCGIYGWMLHTRFFSTQQKSEIEYERMKDAINGILGLTPFQDDCDAKSKMGTVSDAIEKFVEQFP